MRSSPLFRSRSNLGLCRFATLFREPMVGGISIECDPDHPEAIAKAIQSLRENSQARMDMARRGVALIRRDWNYEAQFAKVLDTIDALR